MVRENEVVVDCSKLRELLLDRCDLSLAEARRRLERRVTPSVLLRWLGGSLTQPTKVAVAKLMNLEEVMRFARSHLGLNESELPLESVTVDPSTLAEVAPEPTPFSLLLTEHLSTGTRPDGATMPWSDDEFAKATGWKLRVVRQWKAGGTPPGDIKAIAGVLFGENLEWTADARRCLEVAWAASARPAPLRADKSFPKDFVRSNGLELMASTIERELLRSKPNALPYASLHSFFKGRESIIQNLRRLFDRSSQSNSVSIISKAVHGLGGIGKTRLAVEYAWRYAIDYSALLFAVSASAEMLDENLAMLAGPLALNLPEQSAHQTEEKIRAVLAWLNANPSWLLILDNVDDAEAADAVQRMLPRLCNGHVLITGRFANIGAEITAMELDVLLSDDAIAFLFERTAARRRAAPDDLTTVYRLADELGGLALALEQAAAYIAHHRMDFKSYLETWCHARQAVLAWHDPVTMHYPSSVAATWKTSVSRLSVHPRQLLERLSWFSPESIPESLLQVTLPNVTFENSRNALAMLDSYSLISRDSNYPRFSVHRLVQDVTRRSLGTKLGKRRLREVLAWIDQAFAGDGNDVRNWPRLDPLLPHALSVVQHADDAGTLESATGLMHRLGNMLSGKARYHEAESMLRRAVELCESTSPTDPDWAGLLGSLGSLLHDTNRPAEAEVLYRRILAVEETSLGPDHDRVATTLNNLAILLHNTGRLAEAELLCRRALAIGEANLGPDHPVVATRLSNLATLLGDMSRMSEAETLYRRALAIDEANFGADHPNVAASLNNLALLLKREDKADEAEALYRRALVIYEAVFEHDHPKVASCLSNLSTLLHDTNRTAESEALCRRALSIEEAAFGPDHPAVAISLNNLGSLLQDTDRLLEAEPLYRRALAIGEATETAADPGTAIRLGNLAGLLQQTERLSEAEPLSRRALLILIEFERRTGHSNPNTATAISKYRDILTALGLSEAEAQAAIADLLRKNDLSC